MPDRQRFIAEDSAALASVGHRQPFALTHTDDAVATVQALGTFTSTWGDALPHDAAWLARVAHWLAQIDAHGLLAALAQLNFQNSS